jgi:hypothetical protein
MLDWGGIGFLCEIFIEIGHMGIHFNVEEGEDRFMVTD